MAVDYTVTFSKDGKFENGDYVLTANNLDDLSMYIRRVFSYRFDSFVAHVPAPIDMFYYGEIRPEWDSIFYTLYVGGESSDFAVDEFSIYLGDM